MAESQAFQAGGMHWPLRITPPVARRIRDELGVDLFAVTAPPAENPFSRMADDLYLLSDVIWALCGRLATERHLLREQFDELVWESIDDAAETLLAAVVESFPEKKRVGLTKLVAAQNAALDRVIERIGPKMDQLIDAELDAVVDAALNSTRSTRTNSPTD